MPQDVTLAVKNLRGLQRAFRLASRESYKGLRASIREAVEPVRVEAEIRAATAIPRVGPNWSRMRTGITQSVVYVAPRQKGRASRVNRKLRRPNLADLLLDRAMIPALHSNIPRVMRGVERMLAEVGREWERSPDA